MTEKPNPFRWFYTNPSGMSLAAMIFLLVTAAIITFVDPNAQNPAMRFLGFLASGLLLFILFTSAVGMGLAANRSFRKARSKQDLRDLAVAAIIFFGLTIGLINALMHSDL